MKKRIVSFAFALLLCLAPAFLVSADRAVPNLNDEANLLTDAQEARLQQRMDEISGTYNVEIAIVTKMNIGNASPSRYASAYYDSNAFGYGDSRDGVLLLISMKDRDYYILTNGLGSKAIDGGDIDGIGDTIVPYLSGGDYADAFDVFLDECAYQLDGEINGFPFAFGKNALIALGIGIVTALIATGIMKSKLKSVRRQYTATEYTRSGSMQLHHSTDRYLYRTVNRVRRQTNSSGGSHSSGGFRSSGGSRGGGGGKF